VTTGTTGYHRLNGTSMAAPLGVAGERKTVSWVEDGQVCGCESFVPSNPPDLGLIDPKKLRSQVQAD
jgi:hypothetical protein